jgi:acyl-[acyl-carrier-protein]-phospholipid O-acyltransferase/long-chain-fatty-acid--[acyl-carrier-protein] ligase
MTKSFLWLNITQAIGALIDNTFKMLTVIYLVSALNRELSPTLALTSALLVIPFILFSNWAGALTDRYSKRNLVVIVKWTELILLLLAFPALYSGRGFPMLAILFLLAAQSAFFGPVKRGIVPELVAKEDLPQANSQMTAFTYLAIILGLCLPSLAITVLHLNYVTVLAICVAISIAGLLCAYCIPQTPAANRISAASPWIIPDALRAMRSLTPHVWLKRAAYGSIVFSGVSALFQQNLVIYARDILSLSVEASGYLFLLVAIGIMLGAWISGRLSPHAIEAGLIPVGALGLSISLFGLGMTHTPIMLGFWLVFTGITSGMCIVPLTAYLQGQSPAHNRGEIFGAIEFWSFTAMVAASGLFYLLTDILHLGAQTCMLITGVIGGLVAGWTLYRLPDHTVRFFVSRLTRLLYRVEIHGIENLPREGGALLVANHTAYGDATILQSVTQRPIRYIMSREIFSGWGWCRPLFRISNVIQIHTSDGPRALVHAIAGAREALQQGWLVGIFPEGRLTPNGTIQTFHKGFEKIAKGTSAPIIPVHLDNLWGSIFSCRYGEPGFRWPKSLPLRVTVRIGKPMKPDATTEEVRQAVVELSVQTAVDHAARPGNTLGQRLIKQVRSHWTRLAASDTLGQSMTYGKLLSGALALNARLKGRLTSEPRVGILFPPSVGGLLVNAALSVQGKTVVNLNWTVSHEAYCSAVEQSGLRQIITSRHFLSALTLPETPAELLYIEDLLKELTLSEKIFAFLRARFAPARRLTHGHAPLPTDAACIIFSSGSTGTPKGVVLSHANLLSNVDALETVVPVNPSDTLCATLPFFHSFGFLGTLWWPLLIGVKTAFHANPLQVSHVLRLIREAKATTLLTTPTLLQAYLRRATREDVATLRYVFTGGEKLPVALVDAFEQATGLRPLEGYGATELSPVVAMGIPDRTTEGITTKGNKAGSAGRPLPNIATRTVDPETGNPLPAHQPGLLLVKGPNVMTGYLNNPSKTAEVLHDGWYNTGDIGRIDEEGFLFLTDRLSRFSKIGGEMVPHGAIEEVLQRASGTTEPCAVVIGVPDETQGEYLVACLTPQAGDVEKLYQALKESKLPNLWIPSRAHFISIPEIPLTGTGKIDLRAVREGVAQAQPPSGGSGSRQF